MKILRWKHRKQSNKKTKDNQIPNWGQMHLYVQEKKVWNIWLKFHQCRDTGAILSHQMTTELGPGVMWYSRWRRRSLCYQSLQPQSQYQWPHWLINKAQIKRFPLQQGSLIRSESYLLIRADSKSTLYSLLNNSWIPKNKSKPIQSIVTLKQMNNQRSTQLWISILIKLNKWMFRDWHSRVFKVQNFLRLNITWSTFNQMYHE